MDRENNKENELNFDDVDNIEDVYETVCIKDENGKEIDCFIIDAICENNTKYLLVVPCDCFDDDEAEAFILKEIKEEEETNIYTPVTDDNEYNKVLILFQDNENEYEIKL